MNLGHHLLVVLLSRSEQNLIGPELELTDMPFRWGTVLILYGSKKGIMVFEGYCGPSRGT